MIYLITLMFIGVGLQIAAITTLSHPTVVWSMGFVIWLASFIGIIYDCFTDEKN